MRLAETLAAYERGEINVLINAMLLAEGWNSPRATVVMHLAPTASRRVYQQRIGRIMRMHPRKEAGIVVDFVNKGATHSERVVTLHSLLDTDFYREGARVTPAPRRRYQRRARRRLTPAPWLVPVTPDVRRRLAVIAREWQRIDPKYLDEEEQRYWATFAGRAVRFEERAELVQSFTDGRASKEALEQFLFTCAAENPNRRLRMMALADRVSMRVDRADFDDLVTLVTETPPWEKDRLAGGRMLLQAIAQDKPDAPEQILAGGRGGSRARRARLRIEPRAPSSPRPSGCSARSRTHGATGTRRTRRGSSRPPVSSRCPVAAALLASAEGYTPRATKLLDAAREDLGTVQDVAAALAENLPEPKPPRRTRRRRRRKKRGAGQTPTPNGSEATPATAEAGRSRSAGRGDLGVAKAGDDVVVHHAGRLHERVAHGRPHEAEAPPLEVLAHRTRLLCLRGNLADLAELADDRRPADEAPEIGGEAAFGLLYLEHALRVRDRRLDLQAVADDAGVTEQPLRVCGSVPRDDLGVEVGERLPVPSRLRRIVDQDRPACAPSSTSIS